MWLTCIQRSLSAREAQVLNEPADVKWDLSAKPSVWFKGRIKALFLFNTLRMDHFNFDWFKEGWFFHLFQQCHPAVTTTLKKQKLTFFLKRFTVMICLWFYSHLEETKHMKNIVTVADQRISFLYHFFRLSHICTLTFLLLLDSKISGLANLACTFLLAISHFGVAFSRLTRIWSSVPLPTPLCTCLDLNARLKLKNGPSWKADLRFWCSKAFNGRERAVLMRIQAAVLRRANEFHCRKCHACKIRMEANLVGS